MTSHKRQASKPKTPKREPESRGTKWAAEIRAQCNKLTNEERERLLELGMQIAYGVEPRVSSAGRG